MKSKILKKANDAVANATPESKRDLGLSRKYKEHTNYASAFAIGEHAEMRLDSFNNVPFGRIEGIEFGVNGIVYTVAIAVNSGTAEKPEYEFHSGRPIVGIDDRLLVRSDCGIPNDLVGKYPIVENTRFQIGDTVGLNLAEVISGADICAIPVMIWGVSYTAGKITYDISIDADEYKDTPAYNEIYERYLKHSMDKVDSIFITPVGGWLMESNDAKN